MNKKAILEGLLFVVGDDGLTLTQLQEILEIENDEAIQLINELKNDYSDDSKGITINYLGNTFKLTTKQEHKDYYKKLIEAENNHYLSQAALETLAIIAYNEPITRSEVDEIRGVSSSQMIRKLAAKGFVKELGRSDLPGRPIIYKVTNDFYDYFNISGRDDLPELKSIEIEPQEEKDLFQSNYKE